jgi:hypothetical protein
MRSLLIALACQVVPLAASAQGVVVSPHAVFIDHRTRSGWVQLYNPTYEPSEVAIDALFGFPVTDSLGRMDLRIIDAPDSTWPSAVRWISAFPRRVVVPPQTRQTVRLLVNPPPGLADGEYWARLVITARGGTAPVSGADSARGITVGLNLEVRTIIPLLYRKGAPTTGLTLSNLRSEIGDDSIQVRARLKRNGSAAFLGTIRATLDAEDGSETGRFEQPISVYYDIDPVFALPRNGLPPGRYRLTFEVVSERSDLAAELVLPAPVARDTISILIK